MTRDRSFSETHAADPRGPSVDSAEAPEPSTRDVLQRRLGPTSDVPGRLAALRALGLTLVAIAQAIGITPQAARALSRPVERNGSNPRRGTSEALNQLRLACYRLLDAYDDPSEVAQWLTTDWSYEDFRAVPIELIAEYPSRVHQAIGHQLNGDHDAAEQVLVEAGRALAKRRAEEQGNGPRPVRAASRGARQANVRTKRGAPAKPSRGPGSGRTGNAAKPKAPSART